MNLTLAQTEFYKYHCATKHTTESLFSGGRLLDWNNQPEPFRRYDGAEIFRLPIDCIDHPDTSGSLASKESENSAQNSFAKHTKLPSFFQAHEQFIASQLGEKLTSSPSFETLPIDSHSISRLFYYSLAISAWKQIRGSDHKWALRVNASSGNLHPTEAHLLLAGSADSLSSGTYHYRADDHVLEKRSSTLTADKLWNKLAPGVTAPFALICLTSIFWREAWKYEKRGFRYCQHDLGHALAALSMSTITCGWSSRIICLFPDAELASLLGLEDSDEAPLAVLPIWQDSPPELKGRSGSSFLENIDMDALRDWKPESEDFSGQPNRLSERVLSYNSIENIYAATKYSLKEWNEKQKSLKKFAEQGKLKVEEQPGQIEPAGEQINLDELIADTEPHSEKNALEIIRTRRSAVDMDGRTSIRACDLARILKCSFSGFISDFQTISPGDSTPISLARSTASNIDTTLNFISLYLYVHRVEGISSGLYYFDRRKMVLIPLVFTEQKQLAKSLSCYQDIAADSAFALSMIADFNQAYRLFGERAYRLVHYEAGFIGQLLYLASSAVGLESTGIGCFLDDAINEYLALRPGQEVIYNFTIGRAVQDSRLTTLPSYPHSGNNR